MACLNGNITVRKKRFINQKNTLDCYFESSLKNSINFPEDKCCRRRFINNSPKTKEKLVPTSDDFNEQLSNEEKMMLEIDLILENKSNMMSDSNEISLNKMLREKICEFKESSHEKSVTLKTNIDISTKAELIEYNDGEVEFTCKTPLKIKNTEQATCNNVSSKNNRCFSPKKPHIRNLEKTEQLGGDIDYYDDGEVEIVCRSPFKRRKIDASQDLGDILVSPNKHGDTTVLAAKNTNRNEEKDNHNISVAASSFSQLKISQKYYLAQQIKNESEDQCMSSPEKKRISAKSFKDIIYSFCYKEFSNTYRRLNHEIIPECCNEEECEAKHKNCEPKVIDTFLNGPIFSILDNPLQNWMNDISTAAFKLLRPEKIFRGDILRILFMYIMHGPEEHLMWDINNILFQHCIVHPPCTDQMREFYLQLLDQPYNTDSYFKTDLNNTGVLNYILDLLETHLILEQGKTEDPKETEQINDAFRPITYELIEERYNNFEPLFDPEYQEVMEGCKVLLNAKTDKNETSLGKKETLKRSVTALKLVVNILEADFLICVAKLKRYILGGPEVREPLIKHFLSSDLELRIFSLYTKSADEDLSEQCARLVGLMAECLHLFQLPVQRLWQYPNLTPVCLAFASRFFEAFKKGEWDEEEVLSRLRCLHPPWLKLQISMDWVNSQLNVKMGSDLKALVEIIHMHVKSPIKLEKKMKTNDSSLCKGNASPSKIQKKPAKKMNQFGESKLHIVCKNKKRTVAEVLKELESPYTDVNSKDYNGWTPLHESVYAGSVTKTSALLNYQPPPGLKPVDIGAQNLEGLTPLHEAVSIGSLKLCQLLIEYGGICLLRKTANNGVTPLDMAEDNPEIKEYFKKVIWVQEQLNLSPNSILNLPDSILEVLILAYDTFMIDQYTMPIYQVMKRNETCEKVTQQEFIVVNKAILVKFKSDQDQLRKLRQILVSLAKNPQNPPLLKLWNYQIQTFTNTIAAESNVHSVESTSK